MSNANFLIKSLKRRLSAIELEMAGDIDNLRARIDSLCQALNEGRDTDIRVLKNSMQIDTLGAERNTIRQCLAYLAGEEHE